MIFGLPLLVERAIDLLWPCRKYRDNTAIESRIKIYNIITKVYSVLLIIVGIATAITCALPIKIRVIILLLAGIALCICSLILINKKPMRNPQKYWLDWWQGKSAWYKIFSS